MGVIDAAWPVSPRDGESRDFMADPPERRRWESKRMAVYAAQVEAMDRAIGRLLDTLRETGAESNTLVMFLSDNGGCAEFLREDGEPHAWPGQYAKTARPGETCRVGNIPGLDPGPATTFMSYDLPWANASNTPFRRYKHWVHEGGIATPCVVSWPGHTPAGAILHQPRHLIDILPTCLDVAGAAYPADRNGHPLPPLPGESLRAALQGQDAPRRSPLCWEHEGHRAVRDGDWKLVAIHGKPWELYNMADDRTELNDLAAREPARVRSMSAVYDAWAARCGVLPGPLAEK
jgi:arylsulfatase